MVDILRWALVNLVDAKIKHIIVWAAELFSLLQAEDNSGYMILGT